MTFIKDRLKEIKAFVFDVDGVLSKDVLPLNEQGDPVRTSSIRDGFAIKNAVDFGFPVAIISGGFMERVKLRYERLGVKNFYGSVADKRKALSDFLAITGLSAENVLYMGDDLVDYNVMLQVGFSACPKDAVPEIKAVSDYISSRIGGDGCVRDIIEQTHRSQNKWFTKDMLT